MICGRCKENKPRSAFWSVELGHHHLRCSSCRLDKASADYGREAAIVQRREERVFASGKAYGLATNFRLIEDARIAQALAWTFKTNFPS